MAVSSPLRALIFDFDGLILDTETPDFTVLAEQYQAYGATLLAERWVLGLGTFGRYDPYQELAELSGQQLDIAALQAAHRRRYLEICAEQPLRPGIPELLAYAAETGIVCAVASSGSRNWVEGWLAKHAIRGMFACVRTRDDVEHVKPAPDLFLSAAAGIGIAPSECLVLEDSINGMRAAAAAGMRCVGVPLPLLAGLAFPPVALMLASLADLPPAELIARAASGSGSAPAPE
ncbi:MAG: HAD family hydrolase [Roseiflexaceae bacterium]